MLTKVKNFFVRIWPSKRKLIQLYSALLHNAHIKGFVTGKIFDGGLKNICGPGFNCYSCPGAVVACPLGSIQNALAESKTKTPTYVFGIILLYCIILGRTICGYLCPAGLLQELLYKIKTPKLKKSKVTRILSYTKYVLLFVLVIGVPLMYALQENNMPVPAFCKYICPVGTFEGGVFLLMPESNSSYYSMLGALFSWKFLIMLLIVLSSIFIYRVFCRFLCPLGAIYGLFNKLSILGVKVNKEKCTNCHACVNVCKMDVKEVGDHECINCGECIDVCKHDAIKWKNIIRDLRKERELELSYADNNLNEVNNKIEDNNKVVNYTISNTSSSNNNAENLETANVGKTKKNNKSLITKIATSVLMVGILVTVLVLTNVDFGPKLYLQNSVVDEFTTKLLSEQEYDVNSTEKKVKVFYFYDDFDEVILNELDSLVTNDIEIVAITKYDNKEEYKALVSSNFSDSDLIFGYDSVNQTEISRFTSDINYPYIVILDSENKVIVSEQGTYSEAYNNRYIMPLANDITMGNEVGDYCLIQDISNLADGSRLAIDDYRGQIVVLNFWYVECAPCKAELPHFSEINTKYDEVEVIAVSSRMWYDSMPEETKAYAADSGYNITWAYDNTGETYTDALFGKHDAYPATVIIDQEGYVAYKTMGGVTLDELEAVITSLLE